MSDFRYALRSLAKSPGFTVAAIATLALGIGFNTAVFSLVDAAVFKPLAYGKPEELVRVWDSNPSRGFNRFSASPPNFADWRVQNTTLSGMAAFTEDEATLTEGGEPKRLRAYAVSPALFTVLGARPLLGRFFEPAQENPGREKTVVLSWEFWQA